MSESINYNNIMIAKLGAFSAEIFINTPSYETAKKFIENRKELKPLQKNEKLAFVLEDEDNNSIDGLESINKGLAQTSIDYRVLSDCFVTSDKKYYTVIRYSILKSTSSGNRLY